MPVMEMLVRPCNMVERMYQQSPFRLTSSRMFVVVTLESMKMTNGLLTDR